MVKTYPLLANCKNPSFGWGTFPGASNIAGLDGAGVSKEWSAVEIGKQTGRFRCSIDANSFLSNIFSPIHLFSIPFDFTSLFLEFLVSLFGSFGNSSPLFPDFGSRPRL
jgi:hypothetical protein